MTAHMTPTYQPEGFGRGLRASSSRSAEYRRTTLSPAAPRSDETSRWHDVVGPVLLTHQVASRMNWSEEQVNAAQKDRALLGCRTRDGVWVYPGFQFRDPIRGELVHGFADVMRAFGGADVDSWAVASWFVTPLRTLDGRRPIDVLRSSDDADADADTDAVRCTALEQSRAWQQ